MTQDLIERLEKGERSNELDVLIEVALFEPDESSIAVRSNNAGTKVIYTNADKTETTCWAVEWTRKPDEVIAILRAHREGEGR